MQLFTTLPKSHSQTLYTLERIKYNLTKNQQLDAPLNEKKFNFLIINCHFNGTIGKKWHKVDKPMQVLC
jgi:hypothetical protein